ETWATRWTWNVWTKDGTLYEFSEDLWMGTKDCAHQSLYFHPYRWLLKKSTDPNGNVITYNYSRQQWTGGYEGEESGNHAKIKGKVDQDAWLSRMRWGSNPSAGVTTDRFVAEFLSQPRWMDTAFDMESTGQYGGTDGIPRQTRVLTELRTKTDSGTGFQVIHS